MHPAARLDLSCDPDLGYRLQCQTGRRIQYPCNDTNGIRPTTRFETIGTVPQARSSTPRWFTIKTFANSIERSFAAPGPAPPVTDSAVAAGDPSTALKIVVRDGEGESFVADIGGGRAFSLLTQGISITFEAPEGAAIVNDQNQHGLDVPVGGPFPFFLCDARVAVSILDGIAPLGGRCATLTRQYEVTAVAGADIFRIPARAQRATFILPAISAIDYPIRWVSNPTSTAPGRIIYATSIIPIGATTVGPVDVPAQAQGVEFAGVATSIIGIWELSW